MAGKAGFEKPQKCPGCQQPVVLQPNFTAFEKDVINNYPYLIALPFKRMLEEENQLKNLVFTFLNTLKYMALIVASEYYRSPFRDDKLNQTFKNGISKPYHATWNIYLTAAIKFLEDNNHQFLIPELPLVYHSIETGEKHNKPKKYPIYKEVTNYFGEKVSERLDSKDVHGGKPTVIRALLFFRNKYDGHTAGAISDDAAEKVFDTIFKLLKDLLTAIAFVKEYPLLKSDGNYYWSLMSYQVTKEGQLTETIKQEENIWVQNKHGKKLPMLPFFIQQSHFEVGLIKPAEIMMIEQYTGDRIIFHSPDGKNSDMRGDVLGQLKLLLHKKEYEIPFNNQSFSKTRLERYVEKQNAAAELELKDEQKILEGIYQKRVDIEIELRSWVGSMYGLFFLAAEAGSGKTNLIWETKRQYEKDFTLTTIFIRANRMVHTSIEDELKRILNIQPACSLQTLDALQHTQDSPLMILIDGCNEHKNSLALLASIFQLLTQFTKGSLKIVLTWRANSKMELPEIGNLQESLLYPVTSNINDDFMSGPQLFHWLQPMNKIELESAWNNYTNHPTNKQFAPKFTLQELTLADRPLADQLHSPLLLRLFLEIFKGKTLQEKPDGFTNIWRLWWLHKVGTDVTQVAFITRLALLMAENGSNHANINHLLADNILGPHIKSYEKASPFNRLIAAGILTQYNIENIAFTIEAVWHYTLSKHLAHHLSFTHNIAYYIAKGKVWEQAVMFYLWDAVQQKQTAPIIDAIKNEYIDVVITAKPLAQALQILDIEKLLAALLTNAGEKEWEVLNKAIETIRVAEKLEIIYLVIENAKKYINLSILSCCKVLSNNLEYFTKENLVEIFDEFTKRLKIEKDLNFIIVLTDGITAFHERNDELKPAIEFSEKYLSLCIEKYGVQNEKTAIAYSRIGINVKNEYGKDKAIHYFEKALEIYKNLYDSENTYTATAYIYIADCKKSIDQVIYFQEKALKIFQKIYGIGIGISVAYNRLAKTYLRIENFDLALEYSQKALEIGLNIYHQEDLRFAIYYSNIASVYEAKGNYNDAILYYWKSFDINSKYYNNQHSNIIITLYTILDLYGRLNDYEKMLSAYEKILSAKMLYLREDSHEIAILHQSIGDTYTVLNNFSKAIESFEKAKAIFEKNCKPEHYFFGDFECSLGIYFEKKGDFEKALRYFLNAREKRKAFKEINPFVKRITDGIERIKKRN
jgi:tetratricopeptide (TPR) repeat protein